MNFVRKCIVKSSTIKKTSVLSYTSDKVNLIGHKADIKLEYTHKNGDFLRSSKSTIVVTGSDFENLASSLIKPTSLMPTLEKDYHHFATYQANQFNIKNNLSNNNIKKTEHENKNGLNVVFSSNKIEELSSSHTKLQVINLVGSSVKENLYSSEILNKSSLYFETENSTVVTAQIGAIAHMSCIVHHLGDCVVSWLRKNDYRLLTVGLTTYSSDERFTATHLENSQDWTLQIKYVQHRDAGVYECQVSTHPPTSIFLHLLVVEARAEISGPNIRYLTPGSTLRLKCYIVQNTESSEYIFWYHDNRMVNYDTDRGINVSTEPEFQSSELTIPRTRREHSGNYTCVASNSQPASVLIHVFKGDNPAAMYHGHVGSPTKAYQIHQLHNIMILIATIYSSNTRKKL